MVKKWWLEYLFSNISRTKILFLNILTTYDDPEYFLSTYHEPDFFFFFKNKLSLEYIYMALVVSLLGKTHNLGAGSKNKL